MTQTQDDPIAAQPTGLGITIRMFIMHLCVASFFGVLLFFAWNSVVPYLTQGKIIAIQLWQAMLVVFTYNALTFFSVKNIVDIMENYGGSSDEE